jgi:hypothetical protein
MVGCQWWWYASTTTSALSYAEMFQNHKTDFCCSFIESFFFLVAVAAGDFMVLSTLLTFIWRVAEGSLTLSFSSMLPDAWSPCLYDCENVTW